MDDGTLLFFDNGNISDIITDDETPITRIRRVRVIDNSQCETVWQYDLPANLHGVGMGSVQLLDNGNYSIYTYGNGLNDPECSIIEITNQGDIIWKATSQNPNAAWYRSYKIPSIHPDAFSVVANNYKIDDSLIPYIEIDGNSLEFTIYNKSQYTQSYSYIFSDLLDGGIPIFSSEEGLFELSPYSSAILAFQVNNNSPLDHTNVSLSIWPTYHDYSRKDLDFNVVLSNALLGDVNNDNLINVLDVVIVVNIILGEDNFNSSADLNNDGLINVLDVVQIVNLILE